MRNVVVLGSLNLDRVQRVRALPRPGETVHGTSFATFHGGKGANQAVAAARMGATVRMLGCVGSDEAGSRLRSALEADGIDVGGVRVVDGPSGFATILVAEGGENVIVLEAGANGRVDPEQLDADAFAGAAVALVQLEIPLVAVRRGLELAHDAGARTVLNAAPPEGAGEIPAAAVDVIVVNASEAAALAPEAASAGPEALLDALAERYASVVLTLGGEGVAWHVEGARGRLGARRGPVVDTTGAGDTFTGALVAGLAAGEPWGTVFEAAVAAAAVCVGREGAQASIPWRREVMDAIGRA